MSSLYVTNGKQIVVPSGYSKVRGVIEPTDLVYEPSTDSWVEVRLYRPDYAGCDNEPSWGTGLKAPVIRPNERF